MRFIFLILMLACLWSLPASAQVKSDEAQLLLAPPMVDPANADGSRCFTLLNKAPYTVTGSVNTDYYELADGNRAKAHRNFRLRPEQNARVCSFGPFYPGERLELVLRTLVPIFSCYTVVQGDVTIFGEIKPEGGTRTWIDCQ